MLENKDQLAEFVKRPMDDLCLQIESVHDMLKSHQLAVNRYTVAWKSMIITILRLKRRILTYRKIGPLKAKPAAVDNLSNRVSQWITNPHPCFVRNYHVLIVESGISTHCVYAVCQGTSCKCREGGKIWADFPKSNGMDQEKMQALGQKILAVDLRSHC